jgi:putative SOS response-associated peptidase YedK
MCGRFTVTTKDTKSIADRFQVELEKTLAAKESAKKVKPSGDDDADNSAKAKEKSPPGLGRFNVAPTQEILVVRDSPDEAKAAAGEREARLMRWGLIPVWSKDLKVGYRMINAKVENLEKSRA